MRQSEKREILVKLLYQVNFYPEDEVEEKIEYFFSDKDFNEEQKQKVADQFYTILQHRSEIDKIIESHSKGWKINRLNKIDLAILRLAVFEIVIKNDPEIPPKVSINEAIEISKKYSDEKAYTFINGVLGAICKEQ